MPFLDAFALWESPERESVTILIAGDGELRASVEKWIRLHPSCDVRLLGHVDESTMVTLYAMADGFALPSYIDPNPLSVIEALWAGLPILISDRVGNMPEALQLGQNGWSYNVDVKSSVQSALTNWVVSLDARRGEIERNSRRIAHDHFNTASVVSNFVDSVIEYFKVSGLGKRRLTVEGERDWARDSM